MEFKILGAEHNGRKFRIKEDYPGVGVYLYVYENGNCVRDDLQDNIEICKRIALRDYEVPLDEWIAIEE